MPIPKDYPLESFDPRFEQLLLRGGRGEDFTIPCRSQSEAYRLSHMLMAYRKRAKAYYGMERPDKWQPLYTACVGILKDAAGAKTIVHIYSRHDEFKFLLDKVIEPTNPLPDDPLAEFDPTATAKPEGSGG